MKVTFMHAAAMANVQTFPGLPSTTAPTAATTASIPDESRLASALAGQPVRILRIVQDEEHAAWLRAVGMHEGAEVQVLRRAPFGGPIHLRTRDGGEFAIHRDLARCIGVAPIEPAPPLHSSRTTA